MQTIRIATELLISKGIEVTPARVAVLSVCIDSDLPLDVQSVAKQIKDGAHLATIYRTLEKYVKLGILERIDFQEGKFRYEYPHSHHHHAVCNCCGRVEDVQDTSMEIRAIEDRVRHESGFSVTKHVVELFGICNICQKKGLYA